MIFCDPHTKAQLFEVKENEKVVGLQGNDNNFPVSDNIPNLIYPKQLDSLDAKSKNFYEGRAEQYENTLHLTFYTHNLDETSTRNKFIDKLELKQNSKVLEIACGTGRDSVLIADRLSADGELHVQDISIDMLRICKSKLNGRPSFASISQSSAMYLHYPDNYFDALYSFGALGEFSNSKKAMQEFVRVCKTGAKIVIGDESVAPWLRDTDFYKILKETNPMFEESIPYQSIPLEARDLSIHYVIGQTFYLLEFTVGEGIPKANFDFQIPGIRGGTYNTRYYGKLEGVSEKAKELAIKAAKNENLSVHDWLNKIIENATT